MLHKTRSIKHYFAFLPANLQSNRCFVHLVDVGSCFRGDRGGGNCSEGQQQQSTCSQKRCSKTPSNLSVNKESINMGK